MKIGQGRIASANCAKRESAEVITREPHSRSRIKNYPQSTGSSFTDRLEGLTSLEFVSIISNYASYGCFIAVSITSKKSVLNDALG